jgi:hypothetical protein
MVVEAESAAKAEEKCKGASKKVSADGSSGEMLGRWQLMVAPFGGHPVQTHRRFEQKEQFWVAAFRQRVIPSQTNHPHRSALSSVL